MKRTTLNRLILAVLSSVLAQPVFAAYPTNSGADHFTDYTSSLFGSTGRMKFNDWGYVGPNGAGYNDFVVPGTTGFDPTQVGQRQKVVTYGVDSAGVSNLDGLTPDTPRTVRSEDLSRPYFDANMDGQVNFYQWGYTTPAGSTFNNMQIDRNGNYFVAQSDMKFGFYDYFASTFADTYLGPQHYEVVDTGINFQPYAISDARGWCGSVLNSNPNGLEKMAGQVTFDFAFDAYLANGRPVPGQGGGTQIVPGFVMRSYGNFYVDLQVGDVHTFYNGNAVINNTNPITGNLDANYKNRVSFLGGGVVSKGVWVTKDSYELDGQGNIILDGQGNRVRKLNVDSTWKVKVASGLNLCDPQYDSVRNDGAICYRNSFAGYGFLMRADGSRMLYEIDGTPGAIGAGHSNYVATDAAAYASLAVVPVPAAIWLFGSGVAGMAAVARRKKKA